MSLPKLVDQLASRAFRSRQKRANLAVRGARRRRALLESLECRRLLAQLTVTDAGDSGPGTLRDAVLQANGTAEADTILFANNVSEIVLSSQIPITAPLAIDGPGASRLTVRANASASDEFRIFDIDTAAADVSLAGMTLTGGRVTTLAGGAVQFRSNGTLTIRDSVVTGNTANNGGAVYSQYSGRIEILSSTISGNAALFGQGGAIHNDYGDTSISDSEVNDNSAYNSGGAIFSPQSGNITVTNSEIRNNRVTYTGYNGGGIYSIEGDVTISGSTISGNTAQVEGGGVYNYSGNLSIIDSTITNNRSDSAGGGLFNDKGNVSIVGSRISNNTSVNGDGGGLSNVSGPVTLTRSTVTENNSTTDGGGIANSNGRIVVTDSLIAGNTSDGSGGGIATITGAVTVTNSTISGNTAAVRGGGIQSDSAPIRLVNATVTANSAVVQGGGIGVIDNNDGESVLIHNSIIAANAGPAGTDFMAPGSGGSLEVRSSLIGSDSLTTLSPTQPGVPDADGNFVGAASTPLDPFLSPLAENGGPTRTHELASASPARDSGNNSLAIFFGADGAPGGADDVPLMSDQRSGLFQRVVNAGGGATTDMGAFEIQDPPPLTVDTNADVVNGDLSAGDRSLRELIAFANVSFGMDTIFFAAGFPSTITLDPALGPLVISDSLVIEGPGADLLTIQHTSTESMRLIDVTSTAGDVQIRAVTLSGGKSDSDGGAIHSESTGELAVVSSTLSGNSAVSGGGIAATDGTVTIAASTLTGNTAGSSGGAIAVSGSAAAIEVIDSTLSGNTATTDGGGIYTTNADVLITSSTITLNRAGGAGGGVGLLADGGGESLNVDNSIIAGNSAASAADFLAPQNAGDLDVDASLIGTNDGTTLSESRTPDGDGNLVGGSSGGPIDPLLGPLGDNGGPTLTHNPQPGSPAIDAGNDSLLPADRLDIDGDGNTSSPLPIDQRGAGRRTDQLDIGALELAPLPEVIWDNPNDIVFGTLLGPTQLNATSPANGNFSYTPGDGTMLSAGNGQQLSVLFTPEDPLAFRAVTTTVSINVLKAGPVITWPDPAPITFGTLLSDTQLNATADVPGTFVYTPAETTLLNAGTHTLSVSFTPDDIANYNSPVAANVTLTVNKADAVVTWNDPDPIVFGTLLSDSQLNAAANTPGTFVYTPPASTLLDVGVHTLSVSFTPDDTDNYNSGPVVADVMLTVSKADPVITWDTPDPIVFGDLLSDTQLNATANTEGNFVYTPAAGTRLNAGDDQQLRATFTPTSSNFNVVTATVLIDVAKADPVITWADPTDIQVGTALSFAQLNASASIAGRFVFDPTFGTVLDLGDGQILSATFTPNNSINYNVVNATVMINVVEGRDFGDAPSQYPVLLADDGARHLSGSVTLGATVDTESDGQPSAGADADGADDDGVTPLATAVTTNGSDTRSSFLIDSSGTALLDAWIDFNGNGSWNDAGEQIAANFAVSAGANILSYTVPLAATAGDTAARFRISTAGGLSPTGEAPNGEVEDYIVTIADANTPASSNVNVPGDMATIGGDATTITISTGQADLFSTPSNAVDIINLDGGTGSNTLLVDRESVDMASGGSVSPSNFDTIDLSAAIASQITIDASTVAALSPVSKTITIIINKDDEIAFADASDWRVNNSRIEGNQFIQIVSNQQTGETVEVHTPIAWTNPILDSDVTNDGIVTARDALRVINELTVRRYSSASSQDLDDPLTLDPFPGIFFDTNGDGKSTALDALRIINDLVVLSQQSGEGESIGWVGVPTQTSLASPPDESPRSSVEVIASPQKLVDTGWTQADLNQIADSVAADQADKDSKDWSEYIDQALLDLGI